MIENDEINLAIDDAYDVSALLRTAIECLGNISEDLSRPYNNILGGVSRVLEVADKKALNALAVLEGVEMQAHAAQSRS